MTRAHGTPSVWIPVVLFAFAWAASTLTVPVPFVEGVPSSLGFAVAVPLAAIAAIFGVWTDPSYRVRLRLALKDAWGLFALLWTAALVSSAANSLFPWHDLAKLAVLSGVGVAFMALAPDEHAERALGVAGAAVVLGSALLAAASLFLPSLWALTWAEGTHRMAGRWPRFQGLAGTPGAVGLWALLGLGMSRGLSCPPMRRLVAALALLTAALSMSLASLCVPLVLVLRFAKGWLRSLLVIATVSIALVALWIHPLTIQLGGRNILLTEPSPSYFQDDLGPRHHPIYTWGSSGWQASGHGTGYGSLALRGLTCFADHPLLGVGPGGFGQSCPVMTLATYGGWFANREPHNQYTGLLAEQGLSGLVAAGFGVWLLCRRRRWVATDAWSAGAVAAALLCAAGGEVLLTFPVTALVATRLHRRSMAAATPDRSGALPTATPRFVQPTHAPRAGPATLADPARPPRAQPRTA